MATQEQIAQITAQLDRLQPVPFLQNFNRSNAGLWAVTRFLYEAEDTVTAGRIAEFMGVSTARVAVLLKKMSAKGLIVKSHAPEDARVTIVRLSEQGRQIAQTMRSGMHEKVSQVIDTVGMERLMEFFSIARQIAAAVPCLEGLQEP